MLSVKRNPRLAALVFLVASMGLVAACGDDDVAAPRSAACRDSG